MRNLPVHWYEGMFLRPQHFQAAERHWKELVETGDRLGIAYGYGIAAITISPEAITNGELEIRACTARMKDGTVIHLAPGQGLERVNLREALNAESTIRVYLAVPSAKVGAANVARTKASGTERWRESKQTIQDESSGGGDQEIAFKDLSLRVLLSTQNLVGYEVLPICQIQRSGGAQGGPQIDPDYFPPMVGTDAWDPLGLDHVRAIYDLIGRRIETLTQQVLGKGISLSSQEPGDLDRFFMLSSLNEANAILSVLAFAQGVHPLTAYTELCRIIGRLSIFAAGRRLTEVPKYDHDDLARIFKWAKQQIVALIGGVQDYEFEQRFFKGAGLGLRVTIDAKWFNADWKWFVGVLHEGVTETECRELLAPDMLNWKLGSEPSVEAIFRFGMPGLHFKPVDRPPSALPSHSKWNYYEVTRDNKPWVDVLTTQTLAMRLNENLIMNRNELQDQQRIVVRFRGKNVTLEFALFAVRTHQA